MRWTCRYFYMFFTIIIGIACRQQGLDLSTPVKVKVKVKVYIMSKLNGIGRPTPLGCPTISWPVQVIWIPKMVQPLWTPVVLKLHREQWSCHLNCSSGQSFDHFDPMYIHVPFDQHIHPWYRGTQLSKDAWINSDPVSGSTLVKDNCDLDLSTNVVRLNPLVLTSNSNWHGAKPPYIEQKHNTSISSTYWVATNPGTPMFNA